MEQTPNYIASGTGSETVLFLHGIGGDSTVWQPQMLLFATYYRAVAWDMPGYGSSPALAKTTFPALAEALCQLLDHLAVDKAHIVGHSMGGMVAQEFAAIHSDRLRSLVLSGTSPAFGKAGDPWQQAFLSERLAPLDAGKTLKEIAPSLVAEMVGTDPNPQGVAIAIASIARASSESYRASLLCLPSFDRRANLSAIAVPTLVLAAEKDKNAPARMMKRMAERIPHARYHCIAGAGHLANLERPAAFNAEVLSFLKSVKGGLWH